MRSLDPQLPRDAWLLLTAGLVAGPLVDRLGAKNVLARGPAAVCVVTSFAVWQSERLVPDRFRRIPRAEPAPPVLDIAAGG